MSFVSGKGGSGGKDLTCTLVTENIVNENIKCMYANENACGNENSNSILNVICLNAQSIVNNFSMFTDGHGKKLDGNEPK